MTQCCALTTSNPNSEVDFNTVNNFGETPLHYACKHGQYEVVKFLFENYETKGIEVNKKTNRLIYTRYNG